MLWLMAQLLVWIVSLPEVEAPPQAGVLLREGGVVELVLCAVRHGAARGTVLNFRPGGATLTWQDGAHAEFDPFFVTGRTIIRLQDASGAPDPALTEAMADWLEGCP